MSEVAIALSSGQVLLVMAATVISAGAVIAVIIILALIVLIVSLWLYRLRVQARRVLMTPEEVIVKRCPNCNAVMDPSVNYCPNCGRSVPQVTTIAQ